MRGRDSLKGMRELSRVMGVFHILIGFGLHKGIIKLYYKYIYLSIFCLSTSSTMSILSILLSLIPLALEQCLTHNKCSISICLTYDYKVLRTRGNLATQGQPRSHGREAALTSSDSKTWQIILYCLFPSWDGWEASTFSWELERGIRLRAISTTMFPMSAM